MLREEQVEPGSDPTLTLIALLLICSYVDLSYVGAVGVQVESLEDMSDRSRAGSRCFERVLMCKPYSIWFQSPGREWHAKLRYGTLGQEVHISSSAPPPFVLWLCFLTLPSTVALEEVAPSLKPVALMSTASGVPCKVDHLSSGIFVHYACKCAAHWQCCAVCGRQDAICKSGVVFVIVSKCCTYSCKLRIHTVIVA